MFRRLQSSLPKDFIFPDNLEGLGYYLNDKDQIRMISNPEQRFHYFISKNERYVEMHREAMNECIRRIVMERLRSASMEILRLPLNTPADLPHVPILVSSNITSCKRCVIYIGESVQDLGILAGRLIDHESITYGSAIGFVQSIKRSSPQDNVGIMIANLGQLLWYRRGRKALSFTSWHAIPRPTAVTPALTVTEKNLIPKNKDPREHIACVFEEVLAPLVYRGCKLDLIGVGNGAIDLVDFLQQDWGKWEKGVEAIAVLSGYVWSTEFLDSRFVEFWRKRARGYVLSDEPLGAPLPGRKQFGCNVFSSGEPAYVECTMPRACEAVLDYFKLVSRSPDFEDVPLDVPEEEPAIATPGWDDDGLANESVANQARIKSTEQDYETETTDTENRPLEDKLKESTIRDPEDD